jgi:hypothetical protein
MAQTTRLRRLGLFRHRVSSRLGLFRHRGPYLALRVLLERK